MLVFDAHCDTLTKLVYDNKSFSCRSLHVNVANINPGVQVFACFADPSFQNPVREILKMIDCFWCQGFSHAIDYSSMTNAVSNQKTAAFLAIEGGEAIADDLSLLRIFYRLGVRFLTLTWNNDNSIAGSAKGIGYGLTEFGKNVVSEMNRLKMVIDVSHISEKAFFDVAKESCRPFIASHSNSKAVYNHPRNLTDEQFEIIKNTGGMVGINLYPDFLTDSKNANVKDVILHIEHFLSLGGEDFIGLGGDFDGIDKTLADITDAGKYAVLREELLRLNYPEYLTDKIFYKNFMIFVENNL